MTGIDPRRTNRRTGVVVGVVVLVAALVLVWMAWRRGWLVAEKPPQVVVLYAFSVLDDVMEDRLLPAFREARRREHGEGVEFATTFAGSGQITDRILAKVPAEVAIVSSEVDAYRLPAPWQAWRELPHRGVLVRSPIVLVTRPGNPHGIREMADLARPGVEVLHADPATSGVGELAILAAYGAAPPGPGDGDPGLEQLLGIWHNVSARPATAREARSRFDGGEGDVLITYEAATLGSPSRPPISGEIVYPTRTLVAEPVVVVLERNVDPGQRELVRAFAEFLWSREAQEALVEYGFRSVDDELNRARPELATIAEPFTLEDVGGARARAQVLDRVWKSRVMPQLDR